MQDDVKSLSHSKWRCKYHIVFAPKYRRQVIYGKIKADVGKILRDLCQRKGVEILEADCCPDHIHMLVTIPPHISVSEFMGYLKSKSKDDSRIETFLELASERYSFRVGFGKCS